MISVNVVPADAVDIPGVVVDIPVVAVVNIPGVVVNIPAVAVDIPVVAVDVDIPSVDDVEILATGRLQLLLTFSGKSQNFFSGLNQSLKSLHPSPLIS